jgi:hypothetical protein
MGLVVRRAEPQDAPAVARVHVASWRQAYRGLLPQEYLDSLSIEARTTTWAKPSVGRPTKPRPLWSGNWTARSWGSLASAPAVTTTRTRQLVSSGGFTWIPPTGGRTWTHSAHRGTGRRTSIRGSRRNAVGSDDQPARSPLLRTSWLGSGRRREDGLARRCATGRDPLSDFTGAGTLTP